MWGHGGEGRGGLIYCVSFFFGGGWSKLQNTFNRVIGGVCMYNSDIRRPTSHTGITSQLPCQNVEQEGLFERVALHLQDDVGV